jgi:hypothetical protein
MMNRIFLLLICLSGTAASAQDLKCLDYAAQYKKNGITSRVCREVRYTEAGQDTLNIGTAYFDEEGRLSEYHEYFAGGRLYAIYTFGYNFLGQMSFAQIRHAFAQMEPKDLKIEYTEDGKVASLTPAEPIRNFWSKHSFGYNAKGVMVRSEQWFDRNGVSTALNKREYPGYIGPSDNSLTHLFDRRGLEIVHQFYGTGGTVDRSWVYDYK